MTDKTTLDWALVGQKTIRPIFYFWCRRRHTICLSDWSSDVCSSDLSGRSVARAASAGTAVPAGRALAGIERLGQPRVLLGFGLERHDAVDQAAALVGLHVGAARGQQQQRAGREQAAQTAGDGNHRVPPSAPRVTTGAVVAARSRRVAASSRSSAASSDWLVV